MAVVDVYLTPGTTSWTVPPDFDVAGANQVVCLGAAGVATGGGSGGAGALAISKNLALTIGAVLVTSIPAAGGSSIGGGVFTDFNSGQVRAISGSLDIRGTGASGTANFDVKNGGAGVAARLGIGGGGGAPSLTADGSAGVRTSGGIGGNSGTGGGGVGGAAGVAGTAGTSFGGGYGPGGGGGGGAAGGAYGAGAGGGYTGATQGGLIWIQYNSTTSGGSTYNDTISESATPAMALTTSMGYPASTAAAAVPADSTSTTVGISVTGAEAAAAADAYLATPVKIAALTETAGFFYDPMSLVYYRRDSITPPHSLYTISGTPVKAFTLVLDMDFTGNPSSDAGIALQYVDNNSFAGVITISTGLNNTYSPGITIDVNGQSGTRHAIADFPYPGAGPHRYVIVADWAGSSPLVDPFTVYMDGPQSASTRVIANSLDPMTFTSGTLTPGASATGTDVLYGGVKAQIIGSALTPVQVGGLFTRQPIDRVDAATFAALAESPVLFDGSTAAITSISAMSEAASPTDSMNGSNLLPVQTLNESITTLDVLATSIVFVTQRAEPVTPDALASALSGAFVNISEAAAPGDTETASISKTAPIPEPLTPIGQYTSSQALAAADTEAATAAALQLAVLLGVASLTEGAIAVESTSTMAISGMSNSVTMFLGDAYQATGNVPAPLLESEVLGDNLASSMVALASVVGSAGAADSMVVGLSIPVIASGSTTVDAVVSASILFNMALPAAVTALDALTVLVAFNPVVLEPVSAMDSWATQMNMVAAISAAPMLDVVPTSYRVQLYLEPADDFMYIPGENRVMLIPAEGNTMVLREDRAMRVPADRRTMILPADRSMRLDEEDREIKP